MLTPCTSIRSAKVATSSIGGVIVEEDEAARVQALRGSMVHVVHRFAEVAVVVDVAGRRDLVLLS